MTPEIWYATLPPVTKSYFTLCIATTLLLKAYSSAASWMALDWDSVWQGQIWRLSSHFFVFGSLFQSAYQIALIGHYFRSLETDLLKSDRSGSGRGGVDFLLLLVIGCIIINVIGMSVWKVLHWGGPMLLFIVIMVWCRRQPDSQSSFFGLSVKRRWIVWCNIFVLFVLDSNWTLAIAGAVVGGMLDGVMTWMRQRQLMEQDGGLGLSSLLPPSLVDAAIRFGVGRKVEAWQVNRAPGWTLGNGSGTDGTGSGASLSSSNTASNSTHPSSSTDVHQQ